MYVIDDYVHKRHGICVVLLYDDFFENELQIMSITTTYHCKIHIK